MGDDAEQTTASTPPKNAASAMSASITGALAARNGTPTALYAGPAENYGTTQDPALQHAVGGSIVFGGGVPLYDGHTIVGALGVSGDTSCADHNVAWLLAMP
jgi:uncharacterized protein GlcG (DUF336 family)